MNDIHQQPPGDEAIAQLRAMLLASEGVTVFTGAGISTESGIPDFRGPQGIWKTMTPIDFTAFISSEAVRRDAWQRKFSGEDKLAHAVPNVGHRAITSLVKAKKVQWVITQNVDGLHQDSGTPEAQVIELHGNAQYARCLDCGQRYELADIKRAFLDQGTLPYCAHCSGIVKSATISFGQAMPLAPMQLAEQASLSCELFLAIGSSLSVYPAAGFPRLAKENGARLVIINAEPTDLDPLCDLLIPAQIGAVLSAAIKDGS